jgi:hypothetical protein
MPPSVICCPDNLSCKADRDRLACGSELSGATLTKVTLTQANLTGVLFEATAFSGSYLSETLFANVDLSKASGLETCEHWGPSILDHRTMQVSGPLPIQFLRGVGLPDSFIDHVPLIFFEDDSFVFLFY